MTVTKAIPTRFIADDQRDDDICGIGDLRAMSTMSTLIQCIHDGKFGFETAGTIMRAFRDTHGIEPSLKAKLDAL